MKNNQNDNKHKGERVFLQRVFDPHNRKYGTFFEIKGKTTDIYTKLKGQLHWDWVGYDSKKDNDIAIEFKRITEAQLEETAKIASTVLHEISNNLKSKLPGYFLLSVNIDDFHFPFKGEPANRQMFKKILSLAVEQTAQKLDVGETDDIKPQISEKLPFKLPNIMFFDLHKLSEEGNALYINPMIGSSWSIGFGEIELEKFRQLVSHANLQLSVANTEETFLILIEEGYRPIDPPEIEEAFRQISTENYSQIRFVYFVRAKEVTEITLSTP